MCNEDNCNDGKEKATNENIVESNMTFEMASQAMAMSRLNKIYPETVIKIINQPVEPPVGPPPPGEPTVAPPPPVEPPVVPPPPGEPPVVTPPPGEPPVGSLDCHRCNKGLSEFYPSLEPLLKALKALGLEEFIDNLEKYLDGDTVETSCLQLSW